MSVDININILKFELEEIKKERDDVKIERDDALFTLENMNRLYESKLNEYAILEKKYSKIFHLLKN